MGSSDIWAGGTLGAICAVAITYLGGKCSMAVILPMDELDRVHMIHVKVRR